MLAPGDAITTPDASRASAPSDITYIRRAPSNALSAIFSRRIAHLVLVLRAPSDALSAMACLG
ncbi:hypothetical protein DFP73DRAFT_600479 [Morchella snyderi]|nr:hypothetical protein DFP73DRAFT_600479 [Morchella snyderi]